MGNHQYNRTPNAPHNAGQRHIISNGPIPLIKTHTMSIPKTKPRDRHNPINDRKNPTPWEVISDAELDTVHERQKNATQTYLETWIKKVAYVDSWLLFYYFDFSPNHMQGAILASSFPWSPFLTKGNFLS